MNQTERAEKFLEELTVLGDKYGFIVEAEGTSLLYDKIDGGSVAFGMFVSATSDYETFEE